MSMIDLIAPNGISISGCGATLHFRATPLADSERIYQTTDWSSEQSMTRLARMQAKEMKHAVGWLARLSQTDFRRVSV